LVGHDFSESRHAETPWPRVSELLFKLFAKTFHRSTTSPAGARGATLEAISPKKALLVSLIIYISESGDIGDSGSVAVGISILVSVECPRGAHTEVMIHQVVSQYSA